MSDEAKISIVTPHFNRYPLITETYESLKNQTFKNWEWVVVDDGSENEQFDQLSKFIIQDPRIRLIARKSFTDIKGANASRNIGLQEAGGEYVIFLDSDDLLDSNSLQQRYNFMEERPDIDFAVYPGALFFTSMHDSEVLINSFLEKEFHLYQFLQLDVPWVIFGPIWKKSSLLKNNLTWDISVKGYQDVDFHIRALLSEMKYELVPGQPDSFWRWGITDNIGGKLKNADFVSSHAALWSKVKILLGNSGKITFEFENAIRRHLSELVLNPLRKDQFDLALINLDLVIKSGGLEKSDILNLKQIINSRKMFWPLGRVYYRWLYHKRFAFFHAYQSKYFMHSVYDNTTVRRMGNDKLTNV